jgi:hypothetical protein
MGKSLFLTKAKCATCHSLPLIADNKLHTASEMGIDSLKPADLRQVNIAQRPWEVCLHGPRGVSFMMEDLPH